MRLFSGTPAPAHTSALDPAPPDERHDDRPPDPRDTAPVTVIAVIGSAPLAAVLAPHLPPGHRVDHLDRIDDLVTVDALVLHRATARSVAAAVHRHPGVPVIALIDAYAPVETLIGVLEAGADTCVRAGETVLLAGHLLACLRRRQLRHSQPIHSSRPARSQVVSTALPA